MTAKTSPQFARVKLPRGYWRVVIDVSSTPPPEGGVEIASWGVELLTEEGIPTGRKRLAFIETGDAKRAIELWQFDGRPYILAFSSTGTGETIRVGFQRIED